MNYYFPYGNGYPFFTTPRVNGSGLFSRIFRNGINWSGILNGTQRTLSIINQTIPTIKQISPVIKNAKTMFKVMNEFKKVDTPNTNTKSEKNSKVNYEDNITNEKKNISYDEGPTFFA